MTNKAIPALTAATTPLAGTEVLPIYQGSTTVKVSAANFTAGSVTTNANLTGPITSVGNATSVASQTGTGTKFVMDTSPVLITPALGTPSSGVVTNLTGTASININGTVGATTPTTGSFTTLSSSGTTTLGDATTDGTRINGTMRLNGGAQTNVSIYITSSTLTGTTQVGIYAAGAASADATSSFVSIATVPSTVASAFTCTTLTGLQVNNATKGATSTITTQNGITVANLTTGGTNVGIQNAVAAAATSWGYYGSGTAQNAFAGNVRIGSVVAPTVALDVTGAILGSTTIKTGGYTVATLPAGTVGMRAYVTDATAPAYNAALVGGGAITVPVFYNGAAWVSA